jgi:hypothetical protein
LKGINLPQKMKVRYQSDFTTYLSSKEESIHRVVLHPRASETLMSAMADIATLVRFQNGNMLPVSIRDERVLPRDDGSLVVTAMVNNEKLEMEVPPEMWRWNDQGVWQNF